MLKKSLLLTYFLFFTGILFEVNSHNHNYLWKALNKAFHHVKHPKSTVFRFRLYYGSNMNSEEVKEVFGNKKLNFSHFSHLKPIILVIPGQPSSRSYAHEFSQAFFNAFGTSKFNLIHLEWPSDLNVALKEAKHLASYVRQLKRAVYGIHEETIRIITHGIGSIIAANIAFFMGGINIDRIVALDPQRSTKIALKHRLTKMSAKVVEAVHTSIGEKGDHRQIGHRDFYPNGGYSPQPECNINAFGDKCSRDMAYKFYTKAYSDKWDSHKATLCSSWIKYKEGKCSHNHKLTLYNKKKQLGTKSGKYFLEMSAGPFKINSDKFVDKIQPIKEILGGNGAESQIKQLQKVIDKGKNLAMRNDGHFFNRTCHGVCIS